MKFVDSVVKLVLCLVFFTALYSKASDNKLPAFAGNAIDGLAQSVSESEPNGVGLWTPAADIPVTNGLSQTTSVVGPDGLLYEIGGGTGSMPDTRINQLLIYDAINDVWSNGSPIPVPQGYAGYGSAVVVGSRIYVFGGIQGAGTAATPINNLWIYDIPSDQWVAGRNLPNGPRFGSAVGVVNGKIIVAGGGSTVIETNTSQYDPATDMYTPLADMPSGFTTYRIHAVGLDSEGSAGQLHAFGGGLDSTGDGNEHWLYDVATDNWSAGPSMPFAVTDPGVVTDGTRIYVTGGTTGLPGRLQIYDLSSRTWSQGAVMAVPCNNTSAGLIYGYIYDVGCYTGAGSSPNNQSTLPP